MAVYDWRRRRSPHFGDLWVPFAVIELQAAVGLPRRMTLQIDSGAVISLLRRSAAAVLGVELEAGRRVELTAVGGGSTPVWLHDLPVRFEPSEPWIQIPFAISEKETVPKDRKSVV